MKPGQRAFQKQLRKSSGRRSEQQNKANLSAQETQSDYADPVAGAASRQRRKGAFMAGPCLLASGPHSACPLPQAHGTASPSASSGHGEASFIRLQGTGEVREGRQEKPEAADGFKVKAVEIRDGVFVLETGSGTD